jgi:hypothetical protein
MPEEKKELPTHIGGIPLPAEDAPMVKCERCGLEYKQGGPHAMFCRGNVPPGSKCVECGANAEEDDIVELSECQGCGEIVCDCCKEDGTHEC